MASLQYVIDSICSKLTAEWMYRLIMSRLSRGPFRIAEVVPVIRNEDRSLDDDSAHLLAEAAVQALAERGDIAVEGDLVCPVA